MIKEFRQDRGSIDAHFDSNGFLHVDGMAAKTGVLLYRNADGSTRRELVTDDVLFNADSMKSLAGIPVTNNHPTENNENVLVTPDNYNTYSVGSITRSDKQGSSLSVALSVNHADAISSIKAGKKELSCGYSVQLDDKSGVFNGEHYDAVQISRIYNHLAIVNKGRAGSECRLNLDTAQEIEETKDIKIMAEIKLPSGLSVNIDDAAVATAVQNEVNALQTNLDGLSNTIDEQKSDISKLQANVDAKDEEIKKRVDASDDSNIIAETINTIEQCKRLDAKFEYLKLGVMLTPAEMRKTALTTAKINVDGKDDSYIAARFDLAIEAIEADNIAKQRESVNVDSIAALPKTAVQTFMQEQAERK